jgi:hypothetical protein
MKTLKLTVVVMAIGAIVAVATPLGSPCSVNPVLFATGNTDACEINGFYVSNFQVPSGSLPTDGSLQFSSSLGGIVLNLESANLLSNFTMTYTVQLDPAVWTNPLTVISSANVGMQANGSADALLTKTVTPGGTDTFTQSGNVGTDSGPITGINATSANVQDVYAYTSGTILNASNSFIEFTPTVGNVPEPSTMILMGGALIGLGSIARKRRKTIS